MLYLFLRTALFLVQPLGLNIQTRQLSIICFLLCKSYYEWIGSALHFSFLIFCLFCVLRMYLCLISFIFLSLQYSAYQSNTILKLSDCSKLSFLYINNSLSKVYLYAKVKMHLYTYQRHSKKNSQDGYHQPKASCIKTYFYFVHLLFL